MRRLLSLILKLLLLGLLAGVLYLSNNLFLMVGGSEFTSFMAAPRVPVQLVAFLICTVALLVPSRKSTRVGLYGVAILAALIGSHRLLVDNLHDRISDVYLAIPVQVLPIDPADEAGLSMRRVFGGIEIGPKKNDHMMRVISPAVIGLDERQLAVLIPR